MKLVKKGCYCELPYGEPIDPSIKDYIEKSAHKEQKENICRYLTNGVPLAVCCDLAEDVINPANGISGCPTMMTDGKYVWFGDLTYYVQKYNLFIDEDFYDHMKMSNWEIKLSNEDVDYNNIYIDGEKLFDKTCCNMKFHIIKKQ